MTERFVLSQRPPSKANNLDLLIVLCNIKNILNSLILYLIYILSLNHFTSAEANSPHHFHCLPRSGHSVRDIHSHLPRKFINLPFTFPGLSLVNRPLLFTTGRFLSCSLASLRFLANRLCALIRLLPKLPSPRFQSFNDSSLRADFKAGTQTPRSSKWPFPSDCRLPRTTSSKARSSKAFFLLLPRREERRACDGFPEVKELAFPGERKGKHYHHMYSLHSTRLMFYTRKGRSACSWAEIDSCCRDTKDRMGWPGVVNKV